MTATAPPTSEYLAAPNEVISAASGINYACRQVGDGTPALVLQLPREPRQLGSRPDRRGDKLTTWQTRQAQYDAVCDWGIPDHGQLQRVSAIGMPVFVANGDGDPMILPHFSYLLAGLIPQARVKIYPDAAHGFLFQHHADFARDADAFLAD